MSSQPDPVRSQVITFGAFVLGPGGVRIEGTARLPDFRRALVFAAHAEHHAALWKADLLEYGASKPEWQGVIDQVIDAEHFTEATVRQYRYVARAVPPERRRPALSFAHHAEVASLQPAEQTEWLTRADEESLSASELRQEIRRGRARRVLRGQATDCRDAQAKVTDAAWLASQACREIGRDDCRHAERKIAEARKYLDQCERHLRALRTLVGASVA